MTRLGGGARQPGWTWRPTGVLAADPGTKVPWIGLLFPKNTLSPPICCGELRKSACCLDFQARGDVVTSPAAQPRADFRSQEKADTINKTKREQNLRKTQASPVPGKIKGPRKYLQRSQRWPDLGLRSRPLPHRAAPGRLLCPGVSLLTLASGNRRERCCLFPPRLPQRLILFF